MQLTSLFNYPKTIINIMGTLCSCVCPNKPDIEDFNNKTSHFIHDSSDINSTRLDKDQFIFLKQLGTGQYSKVYLVKKIESGELFAMKVLCKKYIDHKRQKFYTISEKNILMKLNSPFIVKLKYSFQDLRNLYIVMEFVEGGELIQHIKKQGGFSEEIIKFYIAELILAVEYLHRNGIIYRDLKPENVLIGEDGHIKLTDFGNSKTDIDDINSTAYTMCGTTKYLAPEIIKSQGYNKAVDYWSLGVLSYEMITGISPFDSDNKEVVYKKILSKELNLKGLLSFMASDVIDKLLTIDVKFK